MGNATSLESSTNSSYIRVSKITSATNEFGEAIEKQSVTYEVNDRVCNLTLTKTRPPGQKFIISMFEITTSVRIEAQIVEGGHVVVNCARACCGGTDESPSSIKKWIDTFIWKNKVLDLTSRQNLVTRSTEDGGIVETCILFIEGAYFRPNKEALIVLQWNKKARDQSAYMVTVAHYFIHLDTNIGFSLIAQIHGKEGLKLVGPIQHPGAALYQVMEQSKRNACWIPKACPHCAHGYEQRQSSQPKKRDQRQSESNSEEDSNRAATTIHIEAVQLTNNGVTIGNRNGCMNFIAEKVLVYLGGKHI